MVQCVRPSEVSYRKVNDISACLTSIIFIAINHLDEVDSIVSLAFNPKGTRLFAGGNRMIRIFDLTRSGGQIESRATSKTKKSREGQRGIISCIAFNPDHSGIYAAGSYGRSVFIYSEVS